MKKLFISEKLPKFSDTRQGTEVFILSGDMMISVYDDYTKYPDSTARSWRVNVYDRETGCHYDRICMHNGIYPTRERALAEIMRFKYRGEHLIFYVLPIGFAYSKSKLMWGSEEEFDIEEHYPAAIEEQQQEAKKRLFVMTGRTVRRNIDLRRKYKGTFYEDVLESFYNDKICQSDKLFPFEIISSGAVLYVGGNKAYWSSERMCLEWKGKYRDGIAAAFVYNYSSPELSEYGDIAFKFIGGRLIRTA